MGVLDHLKPRPPGVKPEPSAPAIPDRHIALAPGTGDVLVDRLLEHNAAPLELLKRYDADGRWNPPKGYRGASKRASAILGHYTGDGEELLVWMLLLARGELGAPRRYVYPDGKSEVRFDGPPPGLELMADAAKWCADRIYGKAPETVVSVTKSLDASTIDLDKLSTEQLRALGEILRAPVAEPRPAAIEGTVTVVE
jgi:hypothetical protein